jgi:glycosyltransferase involved in cell wall biosynthesis
MKIFIKFLMAFSLGIFIPTTSKVLLFTYSYNRPDFIEIQYKTFKKFLFDEYEFIVFNDASDEHMRSAIEQMCQKLEIPCIRIPQEIHDPIYNASDRNCKGVQYSLNLLGYTHNDILALIDSDMFLIKEFSIREYMKDYDLAGLHQIRGHVNYLWIGLVFLNMATMPNKTTINFNCGLIDNTRVDSGGFTYYYLRDNPTAKIRYLENMFYIKDFFCDLCTSNNLNECDHHCEKMKSLNFSNALINLTCQSPHSIMEVYLQNTFLHYRAGSNWNWESATYHERKTKLLNNFFEELLNNKIN